MDYKSKIFLIAGPTASGKSKIAINLAKKIAQKGQEKYFKLFNEIESEFSGKILKILVDDQSPVEFDQPLFIIDPS